MVVRSARADSNNRMHGWYILTMFWKVLATQHGGLETFSMLMLDFDYNGDVFTLDAVFYNHQLEEQEWRGWFSGENLGEQIMAVFMDIHGNESQVVIPRAQFDLQQQLGSTV